MIAVEFHGNHGHGHTRTQENVMTTLANQATRARTQNYNPDPDHGPAAGTDTNRRVHARNDQMEVVRYDRTSKWYLEPIGFPDLPRQKVTIDGAVQYAYLECVDRTRRLRPEASVNLGLPGGNTFDRKFTALSAVER